jgi:hypothetical protein
VRAVLLPLLCLLLWLCARGMLLLLLCLRVEQGDAPFALQAPGN